MKCSMINGANERVVKTLIASCLISTIIISTLPFFAHGIPMTYGHDLVFHLERIQSIADGLIEGQFPVRLYADLAFGYGYPLGICYPDIFLYFPALLVLIGLSLKTAYVVFLFVINAFTAVSSFLCFKSVFSSRRVGLAISIVWTLAPYRLTDLFVRASIGEILALSFLPLIAYGIWSICLNTTDKHSPVGWLALGIGTAGIVQSHVLSIVLVLLSGIPIFIVAIFIGTKRFGFKRLKSILINIGKAFALCVCLSLWFIVPFLDFYITEDLLIKHVEPFANENVIEPFQLFVFDWRYIGWSAPFSYDVSSDMPIYIGWALLVSLPGSMVYFASNGSKKSDGRTSMLSSLIIVALVLMLMCTYLFPWHLESEQSILGSIVSKIAVIQFPWRLVGEISFILAIVLGFVFSEKNPFANHFVILSLTLALIGSGFAVSSFSQESKLLDEATYYTITNHEGPFIMGVEYLPFDTASVDKLEQSHINVPVPNDSGKIEIENWIRSSTAKATITASNSGVDDASIQLPMFYYDNWKLKSLNTSGQAEGAYLENVKGGLNLVISPGMSQSFEIVFEKPQVWVVSELISLISTVVVALYCLMRFTGIAELFPMRLRVHRQTGA